MTSDDSNMLSQQRPVQQSTQHRPKAPQHLSATIFQCYLQTDCQRVSGYGSKKPYTYTFHIWPDVATCCFQIAVQLHIACSSGNKNLSACTPLSALPDRECFCQTQKSFNWHCQVAPWWHDDEVYILSRQDTFRSCLAFGGGVMGLKK